MLVIRFVRAGRKGQAFFKLVAAEQTRAVQKKFIAELGHYDPHTEGGKGSFVVDKEAVKKYLSTGAQPSQTAARRLAAAGIKEAEKFIEKRPTKPKKEEPVKEVVQANPEETSEEKSE
jgi:small subunit ribosomal protein S16